MFQERLHGRRRRILNVYETERQNFIFQSKPKEIIIKFLKSSLKVFNKSQVIEVALACRLPLKRAMFVYFIY